MMNRFKTSRGGLVFAVLAAAALLATPILSSAQSPSGPTRDAAAEPNLMELQMKTMGIQQALMRARELALQDATLKAQHEAIEKRVEDAMRAADSDFDKKIARMNSIGEELQGLQSSPNQDTAKMQTLLTEAQSLQVELGTIHTQVAQVEPLAGEIAALQLAVVAKMTEVDPETPKNIEALEQAALQLGGQQP